MKDKKTLTKSECNILNNIVDVWEGYLKLSKQHPDDIEEFRHAIHTLQYLIMIREVRRNHSDAFYNEETE